MGSSPEGFRLEDWMDMLVEEGTYVISPSRVTDIPRSLAVLTVTLEENEPEAPEANQLDRAIKARPVVSTSVPSQPTYLLPSDIKSRLAGIDLTRTRTLFGIPDEY